MYSFGEDYALLSSSLFNVIDESAGIGVPKNDAEALKWIRKAAEQGYAPGQYALGTLYQTGMNEGVPVDYVQAHMWHGLAAAQGDQASKVSRHIIARGMAPDQIVEAERLASEWLEKHGKAE